MSGLGTGRYSLSFSPCGKRSPQPGLGLGPASQVTAPRTTTVDVRLKPGGSISGLVLDGSTAGTPTLGPA